MSVKELVLTAPEIEQIEGTVSEMLDGQSTIEVNDQFVDDTHLYSQELPRSLRQAFYGFRQRESSASLWVRGFHVRGGEVGPTPLHLPPDEVASRIGRLEVVHFLLAALLGEPIGWTSQQYGRILNDIIPIEEDADKRSGSGSRDLFDLHTEDAFHRYRPDYIGLMCMRNSDLVPTIISTTENLNIPDWAGAALSEPRFFMGVNPAHTTTHPDEVTAIFSGDPKSPYMRVNLNRNYVAPGDEQADLALQLLASALHNNMLEIPLQPGDYLYLDNFRTAHGRGPYSPRFDGTDRWLKRLTITSYLRQSRDIRQEPGSRLLFTEGI